MEAVLGVSDLDFDPSQVTDVSQLTAEEFLLYVRYEANHCPDVVRATVDSSQFGCQTEYMPRVKDIPVCHDMFLPSVEWENEVVETFSRFRQNLSTMSKDLTTRERKYVVPSMKDEASWFSFCVGGTLAEADGSAEREAASKAKIKETITGDIDLRKNMLLASLVEAEKEEEIEVEKEVDREEVQEDGEILEEPEVVVVEYASGVQPSNRLLLQFDQVLTQRLLAFFASWIQFPALKVWNTCGDGAEIEEGEVSNQYGGKIAYSWIFSLLSRLEKPLYMDASATVRDLYRHLCIQRVELADKVLAEVVSAPDSECGGPTKRTREKSSSSLTDISQLSPSTQKSVAILNTVITICGKYFGQQEITHDTTQDTHHELASNNVDNNLTAADDNMDEIKRKEEIKRYFAEMSAKYPTLVRDEDLYKRAGNFDNENYFATMTAKHSTLVPDTDFTSARVGVLPSSNENIGESSAYMLDGDY